jgi:hypothetical protein
MVATIASAGLICAASLLVGRAALVLCRIKEAAWLSPPVGLAVLMGLVTVAIRLPGHAVTAAVLAALLTLAAAAVLVLRRVPPLPREGLWIALLTGAALLVPFLANGRFGLPGVSFNNDLSVHLLWTEQLRRPDVTPPPGGYPLGPHAVVATFAEVLGAGVDRAFTGLLAAASVLVALTATGALHVLRAHWRVLAAVAAGLCYLMAAYYAQGAFKETLQVLFVLGFAVGLIELERGGLRPAPLALVPLGLIAAGTVYNYSYFGLGWPVLTAVLWLAAMAAIALFQRRGAAVGPAVGAWLPAVGIGTGVAVVLLAPEIPDVLDLFAGSGASPAASGAITTSNLGNLAGPLSPYESFNVWLSNDFRVPPPVTFRAGLLAGIGVAVTAYGLLWSLIRRELALPAAAVAAGLIYLWAAGGESPYVAAKGLVIASPLFMLLALRALLAGRVEAGGAERLMLRAAAVAFIGLAFASSAMALRSGYVGPRTHPDELADLRTTMRAGGSALALVDDDFLAWELFGVPVAKPAGTRPGKAWQYGTPYDFDSVAPEELDRYRWVITTRSLAGSAAPPNLRPVRSTRSYRLWERTGPTPRRRVLPEGAAPAAELDCSKRAGRRLSRRDGEAALRLPQVRSADLPALTPGVTTPAALELPPGRWQLSLPYLSAQPLRVRGAGLDVTMPANLDRPGPLWAVGTVEVPRRRRLALRIDMVRHGLGAPTQVGYPTAVVAQRLGAARTVPLREACGRQVDWYRLTGARRSAAPSG